MSSISRGSLLCASSLLHWVALLHHALLLRGFGELDLDAFEDPVVVRIKPFRFLTISGWCFALQLSHVVLSVVVERQHWRGERADTRLLRKYTRIKDILFRGLVLPCTLLISTLFWVLFVMDRELVYPKVWDSVIGPWMNHGVHSSTALFTVLELMLKRSGDGSRRLESALYWGVSLGYAVLMNSVYLVWGVWFYPFLGLLSWYQVLLFELLFSCSGRVLLEMVWRIDGVAPEGDKED